MLRPGHRRFGSLNALAMDKQDVCVALAAQMTASRTRDFLSAPVPSRCETVPSFLSRLAASKGVTASDFAYDMGTSLKRVVAQDAVSLELLAKWGDLAPGEMDELLSWTGERVGDVRMRFRNEVFGSRALRNPVIRGCPACLRDDADRQPDDPLTAMVMRGGWQLREMTICLQHQLALVPLWSETNPVHRYDIAAQLLEIMPAIMAGDLDGVPMTPSPYDVWLEERLQNGRDSTWLADQNLYAATTFCRLLGTELMRLDGQVLDDPIRKLHAAHATGFASARDGEVAIREALGRLTKYSDGARDEPRKAFGDLYYDLRDIYQEDESFAVFRDLLRECILDVWPIATGEEVLGRILERRRLHSVFTGAVAIGVKTERLRPFLVEQKVLDPSDPRPDSRAIFDAERYAPLLQLLPELVADKVMRASIGATKAELLALEEDGVLAPRTLLPGVRFRWLVSDGLALMDELASLCSDLPDDPGHWESIQMAKTRRNVSVGRIVAAIRARDIRVRMSSENRDYHGFEVCRADFRNLS